MQQRTGGQLWLSASVEDTGSGIAEEDQKKLFESFSQIRSRSGQPKGTGLGLAISRQHARLMGGDITVDSSPGNGSIFRFETPIRARRRRSSSEARSARRVMGIRRDKKLPESWWSTISLKTGTG